MALGIGLQAVAGLRNRAVLADAGQQILQGFARRIVIEAIASRDERRPQVLRQASQRCQPPCILAVEEERGPKIDRTREMFRERFKVANEFIRGLIGARQNDEDLSVAELQNIPEIKMAFGFQAAQIAGGEQFAQPAIGGALGGKAGDFDAALEDKPRAHNEADIIRLGHLMRAHHAGQRIAVGERDRSKTLRLRGCYEFLGMRCAAQEAEVARRHKFCVAAHGNSPCKNQRGVLPWL